MTEPAKCGFFIAWANEMPNIDQKAFDELTHRVEAIEKRLKDMAIAKQPRLPTIIYPDPKTKFVAKLAEEFGIK